MQRRNSVSPPDLIIDLNSQPFISRNKESVSHVTSPLEFGWLLSQVHPYVSLLIK